MHHVYILRDEAGRHYIGFTSNLEARLLQHRSGGTQTTRRMKGTLTLLAAKAFISRTDAASAERLLKSWKNPTKALAYLTAS